MSCIQLVCNLCGILAVFTVLSKFEFLRTNMKNGSTFNLEQYSRKFAMLTVNVANFLEYCSQFSWIIFSNASCLLLYKYLILFNIAIMQCLSCLTLRETAPKCCSRLAALGVYARPSRKKSSLSMLLSSKCLNSALPVKKCTLQLVALARYLDQIHYNIVSLFKKLHSYIMQ